MQHHFSSSESTINTYVQQAETLQQELVTQEEARASLEMEVSELREELNQKTDKLKQLSSIRLADQVCTIGVGWGGGAWQLQ